MKRQITVNDENCKEIGKTFPRRAKQLVISKRARWLDDKRTAIVMIPSEKGVDTVTDRETNEISIRQINPSKKKSVVMNAYRDSAEVILRSSPFEIIKKSKSRTRELHTAFSVVLWAGAAILYIGTNYLLGYRNFSLNPAEWSAIWLVFVFAALIECSAEIYFCRKELAVLNENIDLRQINPKNDDLDLRGYKKRLANKIRIMTSAAVWIPLTLLFFISGYLFDSWNIMWLVFLFGLFFELLLNFMRKLKKDVF